MGVVDLLQKHSLIEADINVLGENVKTVIQHLQPFSESTKGKKIYVQLAQFHMLFVLLFISQLNE